MTTFLTVLHVMVCLTLILVVLLQRGKGADMGAALGGGGSNTVFGSRGAGNFLTKLTTGCAVIFMLTSLSLSYLGTMSSRVEVFDSEIEEPLTGLLEETEIDAALPEEDSATGLLEEFPTPDADPAQ